MISEKMFTYAVDALAQENIDFCKRLSYAAAYFDVPVTRVTFSGVRQNYYALLQTLEEIMGDKETWLIEKWVTKEFEPDNTGAFVVQLDLLFCKKKYFAIRNSSDLYDCLCVLKANSGSDITNQEQHCKLCKEYGVDCNGGY